MKQTDAILALLRSRGDRGITALDALEEVGSFRLAARISDLRSAGYEIGSRMETTASGKRVARYWIYEAKPYEQTRLAL